MRILVTDSILRDSDRHMKEIAQRLSLVPITINRQKRVILVNYYDIVIDFSKSDRDRLAGLKPDYILTDSSEVENYMITRGAVPLKDDKDLVTKVLKYCIRKDFSDDNKLS